MVDDERPGSPSPTLVEEYAKDPDLHIDWAVISVVHTRDDAEPSTLRPPCENFNKKVCLCQSTCPYPHVCGICLRADHAASDCPESERRPSCRNRRGFTWGDNVSYSPCSQASLDAEPLPRPPPACDLPPELVRVVEDHPELFKIVTPIDINVFEGLLATHPNPKFVKSVVLGLREGFWPCAVVPRVLTDESRRQKRCRGPKQEFLKKHVKEEMNSDRFSHPFGGKLLPGMACMPLHVAQTPNKSKFRLIYDHSAGEHSLNSLIPESVRSAQVDRIDALVRALRNRQLNLSDVVLFKSDVSHAFRILPMSPYWQALQAVKINGLFYIDRCNTFGNAASQRLFCAFYSLVLWIAENIWRLADILSYVDDNFSWELSNRMKYYKRYDKQLPEKQAQLLEIWDHLGIPHAPGKQEFESVLTIIGFQINLKQMRVTVSDERLERLVRSLSEFCSGSMTKASLQECQKLSGSINWTLEVNPLLRPGIASLHKEMAKVDQSDSNAQVTVTKRVASDLLWLATLLRKSRGVHFTKVCSWSAEDTLINAYIHASTEGFGIWFPSTKKAFYSKYGVPAPDSFISDIHSFVMVCAIYRATRTWRKNLEGRPGRLAIFTVDKLTIDMFEQLRARDELHHVLLLAMKLLAESDMDILVSREGNDDDFNFVARLSRDSKDNLDIDYPNVVLREFIIPPNLARRALWSIPASRSRVSSAHISDTSTLDGKKGRKHAFDQEKAMLEKADRGKSGKRWVGSNLLNTLTCTFR